MKSNSAAIQSLIQDFAGKLETLIRADIIRTLAASMNAGNAPKASAPRAKGAKRTPSELDALTKRLHAFVSKHPGQRIEQIATGMGVSTKELNLPVKKLIADKMIKTSGQKRATTYRNATAKG